MEPVSKREFDQAMVRIDKRFEAIDKRFDALEQSIQDEIHGLAVMITRGFEDIAKRLDVRERVDVLEKKMTKVESALNVRF